MSERRIGRSIGAGLAGVVVGAVLALGTDMVLRATGIFPPLGQPMTNALFALATAYRTAYSIAGSYVTARLAPYRPMAHSLVMGAIGTVVCIGGVAAAWNRPELGPIWYPIALVVTAMPCAWVGARLYEGR